MRRTLKTIGAVLAISVVAGACGASLTSSARPAAVGRPPHATSTRFSAPTATTTAPNPPSVTLQEFATVEYGMTLERVAAITGSAGKLDRTSDHGRIDGRRWDGPPTSGGFAMIFFRHRKVWGKTQVDLS